MTIDELMQPLVFVSGSLRVAVVFFAAIAVHDVIRNGLHVRRVPWSARAVLYLCMMAFVTSAAASLFRLAGESWAPDFREMAHSAVSLGMITVCLLVIRAPSCVGDRYSCSTGHKLAFTESGPGRKVELKTLA